MLEIATELHEWNRQGRDFAVATVVTVSGSAPRQVGAALAVDARGTAVGSVSGGCVEATVYELCREALRTGVPTVERFGYRDDDPFAAGLSCGGDIDVLISPVRAGEGPDATTGALATVAGGEPAALARVAAGPGPLLGQALWLRPDGGHQGVLGTDPALTALALARCREVLEGGRTATVRVPHDQPLTLLVEVREPPPRMLVFGAIDFAAALAQLGSFLGYRVTVCDARQVFATSARLPHADEVVVQWPHLYLAGQRLNDRAAICVLTHDEKFDIPLLCTALRRPAGYIGAMGSRRTHTERLRRLRAAGVTERELTRLRSPIGLDLGAHSPSETAVSIAAEIIAVRGSGTGAPLRDTTVPIHHASRGYWTAAVEPRGRVRS